MPTRGYQGLIGVLLVGCASQDRVVDAMDAGLDAHAERDTEREWVDGPTDSHAADTPTDSTAADTTHPGACAPVGLRCDSAPACCPGTLCAVGVCELAPARLGQTCSGDQPCRWLDGTCRDGTCQCSHREEATCAGPASFCCGESFCNPDTGACCFAPGEPCSSESDGCCGACDVSLGECVD